MVTWYATFSKVRAVTVGVGVGVRHGIAAVLPMSCVWCAMMQAVLV